MPTTTKCLCIMYAHHGHVTDELKCVQWTQNTILSFLNFMSYTYHSNTLSHAAHDYVTENGLNS